MKLIPTMIAPVFLCITLLAQDRQYSALLFPGRIGFVWIVAGALLQDTGRGTFALQTLPWAS
jgi:hypothetical protein